MSFAVSVTHCSRKNPHAVGIDFRTCGSDFPLISSLHMT